MKFSWDKDRPKPSKKFSWETTREPPAPTGQSNLQLQQNAQNFKSFTTDLAQKIGDYQQSQNPTWAQNQIIEKSHPTTIIKNTTLRPMTQQESDNQNFAKEYNTFKAGLPLLKKIPFIDTLTAAPEFKKKYNLSDKQMDKLIFNDVPLESQKGPALTGVRGFVNSTSLGLADKVGEKGNSEEVKKVFEEGNTNHPFAKLGGDLAGTVMPWSAAESAIAKVGGKALQKLSPLAQRLIVGGGAGTLTEGTKSGIQGENILKGGLEGLVLGAGGELLGAGIGRGFKQIKKIEPKTLPLSEGGTYKSIGDNPFASPLNDKINALKKEGDSLSISGEFKPTKTDNRIGGTKINEEPIIPEGMKERGFNKNSRTDLNNPDDLRDMFTENPLVYEQAHGVDTIAKAQAVFDEGFESAHAQFYNLNAQMKPEAIPLAKMLARRASEMGNKELGYELLSEAAEKLTQSGQFSQAAKLLRDSDPETFLMTIHKQLKKLNKEGLEFYGKKWNDFDLTPEELDSISKIGRGDTQAYESVFEQIQARMANEMPSNATEKLTAWRHISMLLNPKTQIRNVAGNALMLGMRRTAKQVSAVLQKVFLSPEERTQVFKIKDDFKQAALDYYEANKKDLLRGGNKYNENITLNMPNKRVFKNNALEGTKNLTYKLLEMGDTPFYKNAYVNRLASYAQAKGMTDFSKLGEEAFSIAKLEAEQATYRDASQLSSLLAKWKHPGKGASPGNKLLAVGTEAIMPFTKTPINIIKRGIQYSPAGIINGISKGGAKGIDEMAKGLTGTGVAALGFWLASKGIITGGASKDKDLANYDKNTGNSPFSVMGKYSYDWAQPFAVPFTIGAEIYNSVKENPEDVKKLQNIAENGDSATWLQVMDTATSGVVNAFNVSGDTVFNMSVLKNVKQALGNGTQGVMESASNIPQNLAMQLVPSVLGQVAGQVDPTVRQTYFSGKPLETFKAQALSKIPVASKTLEPKLTPFGEPVQRPSNPFTRAFSQFVSPGTMAVNQNISPTIDSELRRLNKSGLTKQFPTIVSNFIPETKDHPKINLTPSQFTQFQKRTGELTLKGEKKLKGFDDVIGTSKYENIKPTKDKTADELKAKLLADIIEEARSKAQKEILKQLGYKD